MKKPVDAKLLTFDYAYDFLKEIGESPDKKSTQALVDRGITTENFHQLVDSVVNNLDQVMKVPNQEELEQKTQ